MYARVLKFHNWVPHEIIANTYFYVPAIFNVCVCVCVWGGGGGGGRGFFNFENCSTLKNGFRSISFEKISVLNSNFSTGI